MAILSVVKRLVVEDFASTKSFVDYSNRLFYVINNFFGSVSSALNNGLTINDNMVGQVTSVLTTVTDATGSATITIKWPYSSKPPVGCLINNCTINGNAAYYPLMSWSYSSGIVTVNMTFLSNSKGTFTPITGQKFSVTFWVSGG